jgi:hypothetical protein
MNPVQNKVFLLKKYRMDLIYLLFILKENKIELI